MRAKGQGQKGSFSDLHLPVTKRYLIPPSRSRMVVIGGVGILSILIFVLFNFFMGDASIAQRGPLSSGHANLSKDCGACHSSFGKVTNEKCSVCHEKYGDHLGVYTFKTHYLYHSNDPKRLTAGAGRTHHPFDMNDEAPCASCHIEHEGRQAKMTSISDRFCLTCHDYKSFNQKHPQFASVSVKQEKSGVRFTHIRHVQEVVKLKKIADVEKACLHCHNAKPDGKNFEPIRFDRHCDACHLTTTTATPNLPIRTADQIGVETIESLQQRNAPGTLWAFYTNPNEFRVSGSSVRKSPVYHEDPWIMENLRGIRKTLYADAGLTNLLATSAEGGDKNKLLLYDEAVQTLKEQAMALRSSPSREVQSQLQEIDTLLYQVQKRTKDPATLLDQEKFITPFRLRTNALTPEQIEAGNAIVNNLSKPCKDCHLIQNATIVRVQKDQQVLTRAHFDHRAHILQRRCLDCHNEIPVEANLNANKDVLEKVADRAEIQNIPKIELCQECHNPKATSNRCVTCHYFHPNKAHRSDLLLYMD
jgi:predicted CXXCH cytochrome family protein